MKGDTEKYTKFMEEKIDGFIQESSEGAGSISRESFQEEEE